MGVGAGTAAGASSGTLGMLAIGGLSQAYGQYQSGRYSEKLADRNADIARAQGKDAESRGAIAEQRLRQSARATAGAQRAAAAASGVKVDSGTAADLVAQTERLAELDVLTLRNNAALEAWGYRTQAADLQAQGQIARYTGINQATGTLLTTGAQAAMYYEDASYRRRADTPYGAPKYPRTGG